MNIKNQLCLAGFLVIGTFCLSCNLNGGDVESQILAGMDIVGRGYDVFNNYADPLDVKAEVLDFDAMNNAGLIERIQLEKAEFDTLDSETVSDYSDALSVKAGLSVSSGGFSGAVAVNFDQSHYCLNEYSFATVETLVEKYVARIKLGVSSALLKDYLSDTARQAINDVTLPPEELFISFGTHVLRGVIIGGRLDYNVSADMSQVETSQTIGVFADVSYEGIFSADVTTETVSASEMSSFNSVRKKSLKVYGGSSEYGQYIITENEAGYAPWVESIKDNPVFCDFDRTTPIIPIWEFCDNTTRAAALESGYADYADKRAINPTGTIQPPKACVVELKMLDLANAYSGPNPTSDGFVVLTQDLNEDAGGHYIYLLVKYGSDDDPNAVTGLHLRNEELNEPYVPGWLGITGACNLNAGTDGDVIWLYFTRGGSQVIRSIAFADTSDAQYMYSTIGTFTLEPEGRSYAWDWEHNLNAGVSGTDDNIWLGWSYDLVD